MRTAIVLLLMLAAASVVGSVLPQIPNSPRRVAAYRLDHPVWGDIFQAAGAFDVFGSWWFALITGLLVVSLVACLVPRSRALVRTARQRPIHARELDAFPSHAELAVRSDPSTAVAAAARILRRKGFRVEVDREAGSVAAEKGTLRELGSLTFHWAALLLLIVVIVGKGTGYVGFATIVEGTTWTDARLNFDGDVRTGRFFADGFSGTEITLVDYQDAFRATGAPMDFRSVVRLAAPDGTTADATVSINHPVSFNGIRIHQFGFGWAAVVRIEQGARVLYDGPVVMGQGSPAGANPLAQPWVGVVKLPTLRPQAAIVLQLYPSLEAYVETLRTGVAQPMTEATAPFMSYELWEGRIVDNALSGVDARFMRRTATGGIGQGWTVNAERGCVVEGLGTGLPAALEGLSCPDGGGPGSLTMAFPELRQYATLQVSRDATVGLVLLAAILLVAGLLPALYVSRRKVWVRVRGAAAGSVLEVGGFALQRQDRFGPEFAALVDALVRAAGGAADEVPAEVAP